MNTNVQMYNFVKALLRESERTRLIYEELCKEIFFILKVEKNFDVFSLIRNDLINFRSKFFAFTAEAA
jgi:hypothetical protein